MISFMWDLKQTKLTQTENRVAVASSRRRVETGEGGQKVPTSSSKFWAHSARCGDYMGTISYGIFESCYKFSPQEKRKFVTM